MDGRKEGMEGGRKEGRKEGMKEGREEGRKEGPGPASQRLLLIMRVLMPHQGDHEGAH